MLLLVKARTYFEARGMYLPNRLVLHNAKLKLGSKKLANMLQLFDIEFQPFLEEIDTKEAAIRECANAITMERVKGIII